MSEPFLPVAQPDLCGNERRYVDQALEEGWISSTGRFIERFEGEFAAFCGTRHAVACCYGTVAIHLLLAAMEIGPGDEVIVPSFTYISSANAVMYTGATPVFVDSELVHWNLDPAQIEAAITPRTRAIMAVHLYGHPADMNAIQSVARRHGIPVIEDAAEAHGAEVDRRRVGSLGLGATFSFYGNKIITTGEGGMVTTDDAELANRARQLRGQGMDPNRRYYFPVLGYNYRLTNLAAALGCAQLERIEEFIEGRLRIAAHYERHLAPRAEKLCVQLPNEANWAKHVHWLYSVRVPAGLRDPLMAYLTNHGIDTRPFFPPMHTLPMYEGRGSFPVAEELSASGLNLPTYQELSDGDISRICERVLIFLEDRAGSAGRS